MHQGFLRVIAVHVHRYILVHLTMGKRVKNNIAQIFLAPIFFDNKSMSCWIVMTEYVNHMLIRLQTFEKETMYL